MQEVNWYGKPYYSLDAFCKNVYGEKLYKLSLDAGFTCPNRDGTLDTRGCIFCSAGGSGDFASPLLPSLSLATPAQVKALAQVKASVSIALEKSKSKLSGKQTGQRYIAYFQAYTNTYGPIDYLESIFSAALCEPSIVGISIATRPDCLPLEVIRLLLQLKACYPHKFIWIELGLQTIHEHTASFIRRGYPLPTFSDALRLLKEADIPVIAHVILGLPKESPQDMLATIDFLNKSPVWGIKLQLLHILRNTDLGTLFIQSGKNPDYGSFATCQQYLTVLTQCIAHLRPDMVIHRVTGDAPKNLLLYPLWSADKRNVLNSLHRLMKEEHIYQGQRWKEA